MPETQSKLEVISFTHKLEPLMLLHKLISQFWFGVDNVANIYCTLLMTHRISANSLPNIPINDKSNHTLEIRRTSQDFSLGVREKEL